MTDRLVTGWFAKGAPPAARHATAVPMIAHALMPIPAPVNASAAAQLSVTLPTRLGQAAGPRTAPAMKASALMPAPTARMVYTAAEMLANASIPVPSSVAGVPATPPSFDVVGAGYVSPSNSSPPPSYNLSDTGDGVVAFLQAFSNSASPTVAATVGGAAMTPLGSPLTYFATSGFYAILFAFGLVVPPGGSKTVAFTVSGPTVADYLSNAMSFHNVNSFGTPVTAFDSVGSNPSMSVSSATGKMLAQFFGGYTTTLTSYNQTQEYNQPLGAANLAALMGYAAGAPTVSFTAVGSQPWGGIAVPIQ